MPTLPKKHSLKGKHNPELGSNSFIIKNYYCARSGGASDSGEESQLSKALCKR
jgi:hypothetical protein